MRSWDCGRNAVAGIFCLAIAIFLQWNAARAATDAADMAVLREFYKNIDNKQILASWKGEDACGNWDHIQCRGTSVVGISMQGLGLQGQLPANLNQLKGLTTVSLQRNSLGGMLPSLSGLENLQVAYLNDNQFDGIPADFFRDLKNLQGMYLSNNLLNQSTGWSLSEDLLGSPQLTNLSLTNTSLTGGFPSFVGNFSSLQELRMAYNYLQGPLPGGLGATSLQVLVANNQKGDSQLNGTLDVLGNMTGLTQVWLHFNDFSGGIPAGLGNAAGLEQLLLNDNQLTGFVPESLASLGNLKNFSVDNNLLDGPIPVMPKSVDFSYEGNYFCSSNAGAECAAEVNAMLAFLKGVGSPPTVVKSWAGNDPCAGWYGVTCGADKKVSVVNLARQGLVGKIDPAIGNLSSLVTLKLNDNRLTGTIPKSLAGLKALRVLDLSNNNLNGPVPSFGPGVALKTEGNPFINATSAPGASPPGTDGSLAPSGGGGGQNAGGGGGGGGGGRGGVSAKQKMSSKKVAGIIAGCVVVGIFALCGGFCLYRRRSHRFSRLPTEHHHAAGQVAINGAGSGEASSSLVASDGYVVYPLVVLQKATNNFSPENLLGKGGFGSVYEGKLENELKVAVKRMDPQLVSNKGLQEFQAEISMLGKVRHRNLVALLGYCTESNERLLVYEFMPAGTLSQHLFDWQLNGLKPLAWKSRLLIALDVAHGMQYLHNLAYKIIIHRDLKPSNILLDESLRAKVSDFGLAKLAPEDKVSVETRLAGTFGYLAPEYAATGRVNTKSDVFSFGVVLMELITGQRALDERRPEDKIHLVPWFRHVSRDQEQLRNIIDPVLQIADEDLKALNATVELAWHCTQREPHARPDMGYAVAAIGPMVREWKPSESVPEDNEFMGSGITAEQAFKRWKIFDDSSITIPGDRTDVGSSQQTGFGNPGSVSAR